MHPALAPLPRFCEEPNRHGKLAAGEIEHLAADALPVRLPGGLADEPHERLPLGERLRREIGIRPDASINGKDAALAHRLSPLSAASIASTSARMDGSMLISFAMRSRLLRTVVWSKPMRAPICGRDKRVCL